MYCVYGETGSSLLIVYQRYDKRLYVRIHIAHINVLTISRELYNVV